ncbi:MAG: alpha/beta hydrolase [Chitinophagales bacterium]
MSAYNELLAQGHKNIFLAGDSAGGGLCMALMLKLKKQRKPMPKGATLISPWTDLAMTGESIRTKIYNDPLIDPKVLKYFAGLYIGEDSPTNPYISPLYGDLSQLPPILIQVGGNEVILDDSTRLAKKLKKNGCEVELEVWENMFHVWHYLGGYCRIKKMLLIVLAALSKMFIRQVKRLMKII